MKDNMPDDLILDELSNLQAEVDKVDVSIFPKAKEGMKQVVIEVPKRADEQHQKLQLFIGKEMEIDCNIHRMTGELKRRDLKGWGYSYYEFEGGDILSSMKACLDGKKTMSFVHYPGELLRYNSLVPVVVYVPVDMEVRYSTWTKDAEMHKAG